MPSLRSQLNMRLTDAGHEQFAAIVEAQGISQAAVFERLVREEYARMVKCGMIAQKKPRARPKKIPKNSENTA